MCQSKVNQDDITLLKVRPGGGGISLLRCSRCSKEQILRLDVPVHDASFMARDERRKYLPDETHALVFGQVPSPSNALEKLTALTQVGHDVEVALVFVISYHRAHVWMTQPVHDANLVSQLLERAAVGKLPLRRFWRPSSPVTRHTARCTVPNVPLPSRSPST